LEQLKQFFKQNNIEKINELLGNKFKLIFTEQELINLEQQSVIFNKTREIIEAHIKSEINKELLEKGLLKNLWGAKRKIAGNIALFGGLALGFSTIVGTGGSSLIIAGGIAAILKTTCGFFFKEHKNKKIDKQFKENRSEIIDKNFLSRENLAAIISNTIRETTSIKAQEEIKNYQDAESKIGIDGYKSLENYEEALNNINVEFYKNALNWVIVQNEYKNLNENPEKNKEEQQKMALFIAQFLSMHEKNGAIENCEIAKLKEKGNSKFFEAIKKFSQLRGGGIKTESAEVAIGYGVLSGAVTMCTLAASQFIFGGREAMGALSGAAVGLSMVEREISKEQIELMKKLSEMLDNAEKQIKDIIEVPDNRIADLINKRIIVQTRLQEGILDANPAIKSRAENFIFRVNELEFKQNKIFNDLINNLKDNSEKISTQEDKDINKLKEQINSQKIKKYSYIIGGAVVGMALGIGVDWSQHHRIEEQLNNLHISDETEAAVKNALKANSPLGDLSNVASIDNLDTLKELNVSLKDIPINNRNEIVAGLIGNDGKLNTEDINIVNGLKKELTDFTPEEQGKILAGLSQDKKLNADDINVEKLNELKTIFNDLKITKIDQGKIILNNPNLFLNHPEKLATLNKDLDILGVTNKPEFVLKITKGGNTTLEELDEKLANVKSATNFFEKINNQNPALAEVLTKKITEDNIIYKIELDDLQKISELEPDKLKILGPHQEELVETIKNKESIIEKINKILNPKQDVLENLKDQKGVEIIKDATGKITSMEIQIGGKGNIQYLDQALRRVVGNGIPEGWIVDNKISVEILGKIENSLANLRNLIKGDYNEIAGVKAGDLKEVIEFDGDKLIIKDSEKLNGILEKLYGHSDKVVTPESPAVDYATKTSQKVWENEILPKDVKEITGFDKAEEIATIKSQIKEIADIAARATIESPEAPEITEIIETPKTPQQILPSIEDQTALDQLIKEKLVEQKIITETPDSKSLHPLDPEYKLNEYSISSKPQVEETIQINLKDDFFMAVEKGNVEKANIFFNEKIYTKINSSNLDLKIIDAYRQIITRGNSENLIINLKSRLGDNFDEKKLMEDLDKFIDITKNKEIPLHADGWEPKEIWNPRESKFEIVLMRQTLGGKIEIDGNFDGKLDRAIFGLLKAIFSIEKAKELLDPSRKK
jgi:hypothetical protein